MFAFPSAKKKNVVGLLALFSFCVLVVAGLFKKTRTYSRKINTEFNSCFGNFVDASCFITRTPRLVRYIGQKYMNYKLIIQKNNI